ncbi:MAG: TonB-dependent receptor plug domain-containing protein [Saprospiraceae bacterium]
MFRNLRVFMFILFGICSIPNICIAQDVQTIINSATQDFESGQFGEAKQQVFQCFSGRKFDNIKLTNDAYRLLSLISIAEDSIFLARKYIKRIIQSNPDYKGPVQNFIFDQLLQQILSENQAITVSAVSKKAEDIRVAPASVLILNRNDIVERGYVDLIDVLSNLPGFDISKYYGVNYANVYQLGFRQENTERTLLMINGIEENDNWSNIAYMARQYPLSNIKAIEILYGPSSTMYGPRAFVGTINIITYDTGELIPFPEKSTDVKVAPKINPFYLNGTVLGGSYGTRDADFTIGFKKDATINTTFTFKSFQSDHRYDSNIEAFDYDPSDIDQLNYDHLNLTKPITLNNNGIINAYTPAAFADLFKLENNNPFYQLFRNQTGAVDSIKLTPAGINQARSLDKKAYTGLVNGQPSGYSNRMKDSYIGIKVGFPNLVLGIHAWKTSESFGFLQDIFNTGTNNGSNWAISNATFYSMFNKSYNRFSFSNITSFTNNRLDNSSVRVTYSLLGNKSLDLNLGHFLYPDSLIATSSLNSARQGYGNLFYYYDALLFRNDFRTFYQNERLNVMGGLEFRFSRQFGDFMYYLDFPKDENGLFQDGGSFAQEKGTFANVGAEGANIYSLFDLAFYFSGTYKIIPKKLNLSFGNRIDHSRIQNKVRNGYEFSPRLALVFLGKHISSKLVYSRGIQNISLFTKFSTGGNKKPNADLTNEKIDYLDFSLNGVHKNNNLRWNFILFHYFVKDAVASVAINEPPFSLQNQNSGVYQVTGTLFDFNYTFANKKWGVFFNHTFNLPFEQTKDALSKNLRIADISSHSANLGLTYRLNNNNHVFSNHFYANFVGEKPIGSGTTAPVNLGYFGENIPAYLIFNTTFNYTNRSLQGIKFSLIINNLLDMNILYPDHDTYYHPGIRTAMGSMQPDSLNGFVPFFPQRGRQLFVRILYNIGGS